MKRLLVLALLLWMPFAAAAPAATFAAPAAQPADSTWYFAEGSTQPGFTMWLLLSNFNPSPISVTVTYYKQDGTTVVRSYSVGATSRRNILVNREVPNAALAMKAESASAFTAERAMYLGLDGHASHGLAAPATAWYFAEGATSPPYQTWLLLANFSASAAHVTLTFMKEDGSTLVKTVTVGPTSRFNVFVNSYFAFPGGAVSTVVTSDAPIVAERSMYFGGSHNAPGVTAPSTHWFLAEGYTGGDFQTWILLLNPGGTAANVTLRFLREDGSVVSQNRTVNPHSRLNVNVNTFLPGVSFGTQINSDQPIAAERAEYFGPASARGGHASEAAVDPFTRWSFAEGSTQTGFNMFLLLMNPNGAAAHVIVTYMREDGVQIVQSLTVGPTTRATLWVNQVINNAAVATTVSSDQPIVAERAMYFNNNSGGTDSLGVPY